MDKNNGAIYDARKLGKPKMIILGVQHMFAMFGATILVPILTGLDISTTLLMAGLGNLHFIRSSNGEFESNESVYYPDDGVTLNLISYYPYQKSGVGIGETK